MKGACRDLDTWLKRTLQANLNALVALALIITLLVGTLALTGFLTVRIGLPYCIPLHAHIPFLVDLCHNLLEVSILLVYCNAMP